MAAESPRLAASINLPFAESQTKTIKLEEEDPEVFEAFLSWLYSNTVPEPTSSPELLTCAKLYTFAERFQARKFEHMVLKSFYNRFLRLNFSIPNETVCELLRILHTEHPNIVGIDPMVEQVSWLATSRIGTLREYPAFKELIKKHSEVAESLFSMIGNNQLPQPKVPNFTNERDPPKSFLDQSNSFYSSYAPYYTGRDSRLEITRRAYEQGSL